MADPAREGRGVRRLSLDDLIALNEEIAALSRAGMPLEKGLIGAGADLPGRLGAAAGAVGRRMSRGESLAEALANCGGDLPPVYRAVVEAGVRSGRLTVALEGLASYARGYREARRSIALALWYPLLVLVLAYAMFVSLVVLVIPRFVAAFRGMGLSVEAPLRFLGSLSSSARYWGPLLPALLVCLAAVWLASRRASSLQGGLLRHFPGMGMLLTGFQAASYADLLALLLDHGVPYPEALTLAGRASGDRGLERASAGLAASVSQGLSPAEALRGTSAFPPLLRWLLATGPQQGDLVAALRQMADRYRSRARFQAEKLRVVLPTVLLCGVGATSCFLYALALFLPLSELWDSLAAQAP